MYLVTKRIEFCYGHRLLDYDGVCKHPHGHNAVGRESTSAPTASTTATWSSTSATSSGSSKGWIDRELDHKMILRHDDPLVAPLRALGEPMYLLESNPDRRADREADLRQGARAGRRHRQAVRVWETPTSFATYTANELIR